MEPVGVDCDQCAVHTDRQTYSGPDLTLLWDSEARFTLTWGLFHPIQTNALFYLQALNFICFSMEHCDRSIASCVNLASRFRNKKSASV